MKGTDKFALTINDSDAVWRILQALEAQYYVTFTFDDLDGFAENGEDELVFWYEVGDSLSAAAATAICHGLEALDADEHHIEWAGSQVYHRFWWD